MAVLALKILFDIYEKSPKKRMYPLEKVYAKFDDLSELRKLYMACYPKLVKGSRYKPKWPIEMYEYFINNQALFLGRDGKLSKKKTRNSFKTRFPEYPKYPGKETLYRWARNRHTGYLKNPGIKMLGDYMDSKLKTRDNKDVLVHHLLGNRTPNLLYIYLAHELCGYGTEKLDKHITSLYFGKMLELGRDQYIMLELHKSPVPLMPVEIWKLIKGDVDITRKGVRNRCRGLLKNGFVTAIPGELRKDWRFYTLPIPEKVVGGRVIKLLESMEFGKFERCSLYNVSTKLSRETGLSRDQISEYIVDKCAEYAAYVNERKRAGFALIPWQQLFCSEVVETLARASKSEKGLKKRIRVEFNTDDPLFAERILKALATADATRSNTRRLLRG